MKMTSHSKTVRAKVIRVTMDFSVEELRTLTAKLDKELGGGFATVLTDALRLGLKTALNLADPRILRPENVKAS